jgi:protein SCO1
MTPRLARRHAPLALLGAAAFGPRARAAGDAPPLGVPRIDAKRLPAPGSYRLARIQRCPDGEVLTSDGRAARLHALLRGRISVLGFMYTYCRDPLGCPLAWRVMTATRQALLAEPALAARSQLVSLSFDPSNDTPQQMAIYGHDFARDAALRWRFLTTASVAKLLPLLNGLGQDVSIDSDAKGRPTRTLNHMLKVFLIDPALDLREIYSVATLDVAVLVNDLRTLALAAA